MPSIRVGYTCTGAILEGGPESVRMAERSKALDSRAVVRPLPALLQVLSLLVHECGRGFESHS